MRSTAALQVWLPAGLWGPHPGQAVGYPAAAAQTAAGLHDRHGAAACLASEAVAVGGHRH